MRPMSELQRIVVLAALATGGGLLSGQMGWCFFLRPWFGEFDSTVSLNDFGSGQSVLSSCPRTFLMHGMHWR